MLLVGCSVCLAAEASAEAVVRASTPAIGTATAIEAGGQAPSTEDLGEQVTNVWSKVTRGFFNLFWDSPNSACDQEELVTIRVGMHRETWTDCQLYLTALVETDEVGGCAKARPLFDAVEAVVAGKPGRRFGEQGLRDLRRRCDSVSRPA